MYTYMSTLNDGLLIVMNGIKQIEAQCR